MKKVILFFAIFAFVTNSYSIGFSKTTTTIKTQKEWDNMMSEFKIGVESVLKDEIPKGISYNEYLKSLFLGTAQLSPEIKAKIDLLSIPLKSYGRKVAEINNLPVDDDEDLLVYSLFRPSVVIQDGNILVSSLRVSATGSSGEPTGLTGSEVANCALEALGVDALWAVGSSASTSWSISAIKTVFKKAASRFLGPVGVAIAAGYFAYCLYQQAND